MSLPQTTGGYALGPDDGGKPARARALPPPGEEFLDKETLTEIAGRYGQEFVGPPLPPKG